MNRKTLYVDHVRGNDFNDGSKHAPLKTVEAAERLTMHIADAGFQGDVTIDYRHLRKDISFTDVAAYHKDRQIGLTLTRHREYLQQVLETGKTMNRTFEEMLADPQNEEEEQLALHTMELEMRKELGDETYECVQRAVRRASAPAEAPTYIPRFKDHETPEEVQQEVISAAEQKRRRKAAKLLANAKKQEK